MHRWGARLLSSRFCLNCPAFLQMVFALLRYKVLSTQRYRWRAKGRCRLRSPGRGVLLGLGPISTYRMSMCVLLASFKRHSLPRSLVPSFSSHLPFAPDPTKDGRVLRPACTVGRRAKSGTSRLSNPSSFNRDFTRGLRFGACRAEIREKETTPASARARGRVVGPKNLQTWFIQMLMCWDGRKVEDSYRSRRDEHECEQSDEACSYSVITFALLDGTGAWLWGLWMLTVGEAEVRPGVRDSMFLWGKGGFA